MAFSATDAAFEGFRIVRRNPLALLWWAALYALISVAGLVAMGLSADSWIAFIQMTEAMDPPGGGGEPTPEEAMALLGTMGAAFAGLAWLLPLQLAVTSILTAAVARAVVRPSERAFGYVRLSMDEVRVFVVTLVLGLALFGVYLACILGIVVLGAIAAAIGQAWAGLLVVAGIVGAVCLMVWLAVRWSLAVPITLAERRMAFFDSFRLTRGRFWPLLGMAILAGIMAMVIGLLSLVVVAPLTLMSSMTAFGGMSGTDPAAMFEAYRTFNPWMLVSALVNAAVYALTVGVVYAPFSAAWRDLKG
ncbi:hypothetical protein [Brevundimonas sp.]|jgi:hypothetical protein|uniref:hypothetical protein n=1 Tax=Brevundimonas sp. TaxID=1871086 RepID=UPI00263013DA|nr:hypothetical protein [Brevundimonas sp.]